MWTAPHVIRLTTITLRHFDAGGAGAVHHTKRRHTPDEFAAGIKVESERWAKVIRAANIKAEPRVIASLAPEIPVATYA
jgi:hypothetical protein